jgi:hypothetical protein
MVRQPSVSDVRKTVKTDASIAIQATSSVIRHARFEPVSVRMATPLLALHALMMAPISACLAMMDLLWKMANVRSYRIRHVTMKSRMVVRAMSTVAVHVKDARKANSVTMPTTV